MGDGKADRTTTIGRFAVVPIAIALALGVAQLFPDKMRGLLKVLFVIAGGSFWRWLRHYELAPTVSHPAR